jgi:Concanavalin A-like lectin/glucanases superfamily
MNSDEIKTKATQFIDAAAGFKYFILFVILLSLSVMSYGFSHHFIANQWWFSFAVVMLFTFSLFLKFVLNISTLYTLLFILVAISELTFLVDRFAGIVMTSVAGSLILYILYLTFVRGENVNASVNAFFSDMSLSNPLYILTKISTFLCNSLLKGILVQLVKNSMLIIFLMYLALVVYVYTKQPYQVVSDNKSIFLFLFLFIGFALLSLLVMGLEAFVPFITSFIKYTIIIGIVIGLIMAVLHVYTNVPIIANAVLFILNIAILVGILAMIVRFIGAESPNYISGPPTWSSLLFKIVIYLPCMCLNLADYFRGELKLAQRQWSYVILLFFEIAFIALLFLLPKVFDAVVNHNGEVIVDTVLPLNDKSEPFDITTTNSDNSTTVSLTPSLVENVKTNTPHYSYGISAWFYIHPEPPKNSYSNGGISILNFATDSNGADIKGAPQGAPQVFFNPNTNQLVISVQTETNNTVSTILPNQILLQRWNHLFINFNNNGIMDVFLNGHLESSTPNVIPKLPKTLIVGSNPGGIYGQVCNVVYYKDVVGSQGVSWIYNTHKLLNPPLKPNF